MNKSRKPEGADHSQKAEELQRKQSSVPVSKHSVSENLKLIHELKVHQAELEMQNEKLIDVFKKAEESLAKSEERFRIIAEKISIGIAIVRLNDDRFIYANPACHNILGLKPGELTGRIATDIYFDLADRDALYLTLEKQGYVKDRDVKFKRPDGSVFWGSSTLQFIEYESEPAVIGTFVDITKRMQAQEALRESQALLSAIMDNTSDPIYVKDLNSRILLCNPALAKVVRKDVSDIIGKTDSEYYEDTVIGKALRENDLKVMESGQNQTFEETVKTTEGNRVFISNKGPYRKENGEIIGIIGISHDITDRKSSEEALKEIKARLDLALDNANIGIWERDLTTNISIWDKRTEKMLGFEEGAYDGTYEAFEERLDDEDLPHVRDAIQKAIEKDVPYETVYRIKSAKGKINYISAKGYVIRDEAGKPAKLAGVCYDITNMKRGTEEALFRLNDELLRSNKELEQFAFVASHDLQEPLRMVSSFTQLLAKRYKDKLDETAQQFIQFALEGATRSQELINDLLKFSSVHRKGQKFSTVDFNNVFKATVSNLAISINDKNAVVTSDELPAVMGDEAQLIQLLQNLIGNSLKFCQTTPAVHVSAKEEADHYTFAVKDNGIGINPQYSEKIFMIFQRLFPKGVYEGSGVGLAICKRIIERHGGNICFESESGQGTTFYFTISKNNGK